MIQALIVLTVWIGGNIFLLGSVAAAQIYGKRKNASDKHRESAHSRSRREPVYRVGGV